MKRMLLMKTRLLRLLHCKQMKVMALKGQLKRMVLMMLRLLMLLH